MAKSTYLERVKARYGRGNGGQHSLAGRFALGQLDGTGYGTSVEPAVAVDAEGFAGILFEFGRTMDGFEQREEACKDGLAGG